MAINVGTLALNISVNEEEVLRKLRKVDVAAKKVGTGQLAAQQSIATTAVAAHTAAERKKTAVTTREVQRRQAMERRAASMGSGPGLGLIGLSTAVLGGMAFRGVINAVNDVQLLNQRLMQVAGSQREAQVLFDRMAASAQKLRVPIADAAELFVKLRQSNAALGLTYEQTAKVTDAFSAALRISGASGQAASSALLQFGQALAKGRLDGDEFRTVAENASEVLRVLERRFGVSRGEILKWREEGKLTAQMVADALIGEYDNLIDRVNKLSPTLSQAGVSFRNSVLMMVAGSDDIKEATDKIARGIINIGDFLKENGPLIMGTAKWTAGIWAAVKAVNALKGAFDLLSASAGARLLLGGATAGGALGALATAGIGGLFVGAAAKDLREARDKQVEAQKLTAQMAKGIDAQGKDVIAAKRRFEAALAQKMKAAGTTESGIDRVAIEREFNEAKKTYERVSKAYTDTVIKSQTLSAGGGGAGGEGTAGGAQAKAAKDTTDQRIAALTGLLEANIDVQFVTDELNKILVAQQQILQSGTKDVEALNTANERSIIINNAMATALGRSAVAEQEANAERYKTLLALGELGALTSANRAELDALRKAEIALLQSGTLIDDQRVQSIERIREMTDALGDQASIVNTIMIAMQSLGGFYINFTKETSTAIQELRNDVNSTLQSGFTDLVMGFFEGLGEQAVEGGTSLRDRMMGVLGGIFKAVGGLLIAYGTIIKPFWQTGGLNPLTAVLVGGALVALGSAISSTVRGRMEGKGGLTSASIGGLSVGGPQATMPYVFQGRPYQSPMQGMSGVPEGRNTVNVNATIIGPNDPQAQRQIATLVNNAARRGLVTGPASRTS